MTLDLSHHGRARMNLPHGFVGLDVTADRLTLTECDRIYLRQRYAARKAAR